MCNKQVLFVPISSLHDPITPQKSEIEPGSYSHTEDSATCSIHSLSGPCEKDIRQEPSAKLRARKVQISASACTDSADSPFLHTKPEVEAFFLTLIIQFLHFPTITSDPTIEIGD